MTYEVRGYKQALDGLTGNKGTMITITLRPSTWSHGQYLVTAADPLLDPLALKSDVADLLPATTEPLKSLIPTQEVVPTPGEGATLVSELAPLTAAPIPGALSK